MAAAADRVLQRKSVPRLWDPQVLNSKWKKAYETLISITLLNGYRKNLEKIRVMIFFFFFFFSIQKTLLTRACNISNITRIARRQSILVLKTLGTDGDIYIYNIPVWLCFVCNFFVFSPYIIYIYFFFQSGKRQTF